MSHSQNRKRKLKGEFVCDWCYDKYLSDYKFSHVGPITLCYPCTELYKDMMIENNHPDPKVKEELQERSKKCPGLVKKTKELVKKMEKKHKESFSMTIIKFK